jgi:uncharacterized protein (TIGR02145 family)
VVGPAAAAVLVPYIDPRDGKMYQTVKMPDGKVWFAQNLNYTKDLYYNAASNVANGAPFTASGSATVAIGSYWCPGKAGGVAAGIQSACDVYGAMYTWETVMMLDGKYADDTKTSTTWDETWVESNYYVTSTAPSAAIANINNARGGGRGICPPGWHVPTDYELAQMLDKVDGSGTGTTFTVNQTGLGWWGTDAAVKLKSAATFTGTELGDGSWQFSSATSTGTNTTGFSAVPAGYRYDSGTLFSSRGNNVSYWSSSVSNNANVWYRYIYWNFAQVFRQIHYRSNGFSVRCVRN